MTRMLHSHKPSVSAGAFSAAILAVSTTMMTTSCGPSANSAAEFYQKAQSAEAAKDLQQAEKFYLHCIASSPESNTPYYKLAAVNRLADLEKKLNNPSKAKSFMNQAATLAENSKDNEEGKISEASSAGEKSEPAHSLAKEKHIAMIRLADWLFEDGHYLSSSKLYEKSLALEKQLNISPTDENSAAARIKSLESSANLEQNQVNTNLTVGNYSVALRGPEAEARAKLRTKEINDLQALIMKLQKQGGREPALKLLKQLAKIRSIYGSREDSYRHNYKMVASALIAKDQSDLLMPLIEADIKEFSAFSAADLDSAKPEAAENATFLAQDLILRAQMEMRQRNWQSALADCNRAQPLVTKLFRRNSQEDYAFSVLMADALESAAQRAKALQYRLHQLELYKQHITSRLFLSEYMHRYALDLAACGQLQEAEKVARKTYKLKKELPDKSNLPLFLLGYADLLRQEEKLDEADKILLEALPILQHNNDHRQLINCYELLYYVCEKTRPKDALDYNRRIIEIVRKQGDFGQKSRMAHTLTNRAEILCRLGKKPEALKTLNEGLAWQASQGMNSAISTAAIMNLKGAILGDTGNWRQEQECKLKAIEICRRANPPQPSALASSLVQAANAFNSRNQYAMGEKLLREAIRTTATMDDADAKELNLNCKAKLGSCLVQSNKDEAEAKRIQSDLLASYKTVFTSHPDADITLCCGVADLCILLKDKKNAELVLADAAKISANSKYKIELTDYEKVKKKIQSL